AGGTAELAIADDSSPEQSGNASRPQFHIVGYLPEYRMANIDVEIGENLTDLVCFSAQADAAGDLRLGRLTAQVLQKLKVIQDKHPVDLFLCVGGWERSNGFAKLAASPAAREKFVTA